MPLYEYECDACGQRFELIQKFSDPAPDACKHCGKGPMQRLQSSPAIQFKGTGWYITDYARKGSPSGGDGPSKGAKSSDSATSADASDKSDKSGKSEKGSDTKSTDSTPSTSTAPTPSTKP
jgi:putative FmdB family regulatory protein